ncbi:MAG: ABC transporter substrate-binding protein [Firmicutes bacterium]|nr:ABC transporter substrate-binding protein [Bacillota bacterium]
MKRRLFSVLAVVLVLTLLAGCGGSSTPPQGGGQSAQQSNDQQVDTRPLVFAAKTEAISLDPHYDDYPYSSIPQWAAYEALTRHVVKDDGSVELAPLLAKSWKADDGAKVWTFELKQGIKFSDGVDFDAQVVKFNFDRIAALKKPPLARIPAIDKIEVVDKYTIKFTLKNPFAAFPEQLTKGPLMVSPGVKSHEKDGDWGHAWLDDNSAGTGPYKLDQWVRGQTITLSKNPSYWQGWNGKHFEKLIVKLVKEPAVQKSLLETGDADIADGISTDFVDALKKAPGVTIYEGPSVTVLHVMMRPNRGALKDKRVRQAIAYAFDYKGFVEGVFKGHAGEGHVLPISSWAYDPSVPTYTQDLDKARKLLADAGYPNGGLKFTIMTISPFGFYQLREAQILAENLKKIGIELTIQDVSSAPTLLAATSKPDEGVDMYLWAHNTSVNDPEDLMRRTYYSKAAPPVGNNRMFYSNPKVDELLDKAVGTTHQNERKKYYVEAQKLIVDDAVAIYTAQPNAILGARSAVRGLKFDPYMFNNAPYYYDLFLAKK